MASRRRAILLHAFPDRFTHEFFIKGAYPERALVEEVYERPPTQRRRELAAWTLVAGRHRDARSRRKPSGRDVESALRILIAGAARIASSQRRGARVFVRLLATPERIKRELGRDATSLELGLLRAMWRVAGDALNDGAPSISTGLPPGFGGGVRRDAAPRCAPVATVRQWKRLGAGASLDRAEEAAHRASASTGRRSTGGAAPICKSSTRCSSTRTPRAAGADSCFATSATPRRGTSCGGCDNCLGTRVESRGAARRPRRAARPAAKRRRAQSDSDERPSARNAGALRRR